MNQKTRSKNKYNKAIKNALSYLAISQRDMRSIVEYQNRSIIEEYDLVLDTMGLNQLENYLMFNN